MLRPKDRLPECEDRFTSRGFGQALGTLAHVSKTKAKKTTVREFLISYVNHPKSRVRAAAISALGGLGDAKAISVLESLEDAGEERISRAAKSALDALRAAKPTVPRELVELRKEIAKMKKTEDKFAAELKELREQLKAKSSVVKKSDGD